MTPLCTCQLHGLLPVNPLTFSLESLFGVLPTASASTSASTSALPNPAILFGERITAAAPTGSGSGNNLEKNEDLITIDRRTVERVGGQIIDSIDDLHSALHWYRLLLRAAEALSEEGNADDIISLLQLLTEKVELESILDRLQLTHELFGSIHAATRNNLKGS